ncbi:MAG: DUF4168 domain-containing protein [Erythrobacter sp.]|nr:DUF4168 domain-containing protein [Erythrobacter sp.]NCQ62393.1 DUF4168 domain-containing protein [Alphaproteobacteria bacterium]
MLDAAHHHHEVRPRIDSTERETPMKFATAAFAATSLALLAQPAAAQQAEAPSAAQMAPVSDQELENFVIAASMIGQIHESAEIDAAEKEQASMKVLSQAQLTPQRFNSIGAALQSDEDLQARATQTVARLRAEQAEG